MISHRRLRPSETRSRKRFSTRAGPGELKETKEEPSAKKDGADADNGELFKDWVLPELEAEEDKETLKEFGAGRWLFSNLVSGGGH